MTTPEPERDDQAAIDRDDALLDAVASGASVDDPAAVLLAEIVRAVDEPTSGGSDDGGGPRHVRTIWGVTLGVSAALVLGGGLGVAAYGQLAPHGTAAQSGFVVPAGPSASPGLGTVTVTVPPAGPDVPFDRTARRASLLTPELAGADRAAGWPWQLRGSRLESAHHSARASRRDATAPLPTTRWGETPKTYSTPMPTRSAEQPTHSAAVPSGDPRYSPVPTSTRQPTPSTTGTPVPAPSRSVAAPVRATDGTSAYPSPTSTGDGGRTGGTSGAHSGRR